MNRENPYVITRDQSDPTFDIIWANKVVPQFFSLYEFINTTFTNTRERSLAYTKLQECYHWLMDAEINVE